MKRKTLFLVFGTLMVIALALAACQPETIIETVVVEKEGETIIQTVEVEKEIVVTEVVETTIEKEVEVEVPVEKEVLIYNSYQSDPEPRDADAEAVQMFLDANPNYEIVHSTIGPDSSSTTARSWISVMSGRARVGTRAIPRASRL
jgi:hypothetical protein